MALIKVRDKYGNFYDIPGLRGQNGTCIYCGEVDENSIYTVQLPDGFVAKNGDLILVNDGKIWKITDITNQTAEETGITLQGPQGVQGPQGNQGRGIDKIDIQHGELCVKYTDSEELEPIGSVSTANEQELNFFPLDDGTYGVASGNSEYLSKIEIPETYNGKAVTLITAKGFYNPYNDLYGFEHTKEIVVPKTVTNIEPLAFHSEAIWTLIRLNHTETASIPKIWNSSFDVLDSVDGWLNQMSPLVIAVTDIDIYKTDEDAQNFFWENLESFMISGVEDKKLLTFSFGVEDEEETIYLPFFEEQTWAELCNTTLNRKEFKIVEEVPGVFRVQYAGRDIIMKTTDGRSPIAPGDQINSDAEYIAVSSSDNE